MNQNDLEAVHQRDGFSFKYRNGFFRHSLRIGDVDSTSAVSYLCHFLMGCGYEQKCLVHAMVNSLRGLGVTQEKLDKIKEILEV